MCIHDSQSNSILISNLCITSIGMMAIDSSSYEYNKYVCKLVSMYVSKDVEYVSEKISKHVSVYVRISKKVCETNM